MRILADENVSSSIVRELRALGHDVLSVKESLRGEKDPAMLARAHADHRLLVTHDKDFGELAFRSGLPQRPSAAAFRPIAASFCCVWPATTR